MSSKSLIVIMYAGLAVILAIGLIQPAACQSSQSGSSGAFSSSRPASGLFEPTISFIRQNIRLIEGYITLLRSILVAPYDRPLVTSTDRPVTGRSPTPNVPPKELPRLRSVIF